MKKLRPSDESLLRALRERVLLTIGFFESAQGLDTAPRWRKITESALAAGDLRKMRLIAREVDAMTVGLAPHERDGLDALLQDRLAVDKEAERAELRKQVAAVLRRGTIASEKERRRLEEYADTLEATGGDLAEAAAVRALLKRG